ncbi:MAG: thioredoxin family protein [Burkholderia sp.]|nr:thioredoxin family protein [Burkholderia sp.]
MPALNLETDAGNIAERLRDPTTLLVACLCAEWCSTCRNYKTIFWKLADSHQKTCFVWIDIEMDADWLDELVIDNFPTVLIEDKNIARFFGAVVPNAEIIDRMLVKLPMLPHLSYAPKLRNILGIEKI